MSVRTVFRLITPSITVAVPEPGFITSSIEEPVKWADVLLNAEVDEKYHGLNSNYSDGSLKLEFTCDSGRTLITEQINQHGTDAIIRFLVVEVSPDGSEFIEYDGKLDCQTAERHTDRVSVSVIENSVLEIIKNRFDTPISLGLDATLDNSPVVPPTSFILPLPGQVIRETGEVSKMGNYFKEYYFDNPGDGGPYSLLPDMMLPPDVKPVPPAYASLLTMEGVTVVSLGAIQGGDSDPYPFLRCPVAGSYKIEIQWLQRINIVLNRRSSQVTAPKFRKWLMRPVLIVRQPGTDNQVIELCPPQSGEGEKVMTGDKQLYAIYKGDLSLAAGSSVYLVTQLDFRSTFFALGLKSIAINVTTIQIRVSIDRRTRAEASRAGVYTLPAALRHSLGVITNLISDTTSTGRVYGSLIDGANSENMTDGPATEYAITSGKRLRGLPDAPTVSVKQLLETLSAHHVAGLLIEKEPATGIESIRIEPGEWFYRGGEIARFDTVFSYSEVPDADLLYNQLEVGYSKFPDDGPGVAEEFNTTRTYQTPLKSTDAKLDILCPLIAAGTAIEAARRLGLSKINADGTVSSTVNDAGSYDDDVFLLHTAAQEYNDTVDFLVKPPQPFPGKPYEAHYIRLGISLLGMAIFGIKLKAGDKIRFQNTNTANDNRVYTIRGVASAGVYSGLPPAIFQEAVFEVDPSVPMVSSNGMRSTTYTLDNQPTRLRFDERLVVSGLTDPSSTTNLELSPARMLRKWALFVNSGLYYKGAAEYIKCTAFRHSGKLYTQVINSVSALPGDPDKQPVYDTKDVALGELQRFGRLFEPVLINCTATMSKAQVRAVLAALKNQGPEEKRLGYVTVLNDKNEWVSGFLRSMSYNHSSEVVTLKLRKRGTVTPIDGPACQDYFSWDFNRFETDKSANPNLYRFCRFEDFK
ncbi:hypothetical protein [uncultured Spirosoma sp.]|uniref:hypothetical protein n=1 Tax=uncultured Spirosoma sp. TaxID=278208 RepID=UPI0025902342|nr:hypothetical protein [uncultured Spirosoma sp.]